MEVQSRWGYSGIAIRKRVQHTSGEVLTEQVVLECLQVEHIERAKKSTGKCVLAKLNIFFWDEKMKKKGKKVRKFEKKILKSGKSKKKVIQCFTT